MNAVNFDALMQDIIAREMQKFNDNKAQSKPGLLLHACCAPCSSACLERLKEGFDITVLFYNPNIEDEEYEKRKGEMKRLLQLTGWADFVDCNHETSEFYTAVKGLEDCKEGGERCAVCFTLRLEKAAEIAKEGGFDYFTTTLTLSPLKNAKVINEIGFSLADKYGVTWLPCDFKKRNGYLRSLQLSEKYNLYRQNFCGCVFSKSKA